MVPGRRKPGHEVLLPTSLDLPSAPASSGHTHHTPIPPRAHPRFATHRPCAAGYSQHGSAGRFRRRGRGRDSDRRSAHSQGVSKSSFSS
jgi:hypothetical protein